MIKGTCSPAGDPGRGSSQKFATNFTNYTKTFVEFVEFVVALLGRDATGCVVTDERGDLIHHRIFGLVYLIKNHRRPVATSLIPFFFSSFLLFESTLLGLESTGNTQAKDIPSSCDRSTRS